MARAATTSDPFNAVAEPRRRQILTYLALDERQVGEIVVAIGLDQPSVSKHLGVLRQRRPGARAPQWPPSPLPHQRRGARPCTSGQKPSSATGSTS